jgi:hypothetical protein
MKAPAQEEEPEHLEDGSNVASGHESLAADTQQSDGNGQPSRKVASLALAHGATGPQTPQGKEQSKRNALKHDIFSKLVVLQGESRAEFASLLGGLREDLRPQGTLEEILVEKMATLLWRYRRFIIAE